MTPDREKAAALGVDAASIGRTVRTLIGGIDVATFKDAGRRYDIRVRLAAKDLDSPEVLGHLYVRSRSGEPVELRNVASIELGAAPSAITRTDRQRSVEITGNLDGIDLGEAITRAQAIADEILPEGARLELSREAEALLESATQYGAALGLAILLIYMVLAAQFESFVHPFTVMFALPFAMVGAFGALYVAGMTINLFSAIGFLVLLGLVTKNSILLVDYANQLRADGLDALEAMRRAAPVRMRPGLMTAVSMIFGLLPAALVLGPGAETRAPMAIATAAGMFSSTFLTLLLVPVLYISMERITASTKRGLQRLLGRGPEAAESASHASPLG